jgi:hypothetical protein
VYNFTPIKGYLHVWESNRENVLLVFYTIFTLLVLVGYLKSNMLEDNQNGLFSFNIVFLVGLCYFLFYVYFFIKMVVSAGKPGRYVIADEILNRK